MAYFAQLDENNIVLQVLSVSNNDCPDPAPNNEQKGIDFLNSLGLGSNWKQTSFHGNFRKRYAGIGYTFNAELDAFVAPQPYASWTLNAETADWEAPVARPEDGKVYVWNEENLNWIEIN